MSQPTDPQPTDPAEGPVRRLRVRRAPRYEVFLGTGAMLGLVIALVAGSTGPVDPQTGRAKLIGYLAMGLVLLGGLAGGVVAVALERFSRRSRIDTGSRIDTRSRIDTGSRSDGGSSTDGGRPRRGRSR